MKIHEILFVFKEYTMFVYLWVYPRIYRYMYVFSFTMYTFERTEKNFENISVVNAYKEIEEKEFSELNSKIPEFKSW